MIATYWEMTVQNIIDDMNVPNHQNCFLSPWFTAMILYHIMIPWFTDLKGKLLVENGNSQGPDIWMTTIVKMALPIMIFTIGKNHDKT